MNLGGSNNGPVEPRAVVATGTGAGFKLFAFEIDFNGTVPLPLVEAGPVAGIDVKLHTLEPENHSFSAIHPFVAGYRREGNLWLRTWQLVNDNTLKDFFYRGYGENAQVSVEAYDIAHRILPDGDYQVVTPVRTARNSLRLITWEVDRQTGEVSGRQDSGDWGIPDSDTELSIAHLTENRYVVSYRNNEGIKTSRYWMVRNDGTPVDQGGMASSFNTSGSGIVEESIDAIKVIPLGEDDFVAPIVKREGDFEVGTWETTLGPYNDGIYYNTYKITDSTRDEESGNGVSILPLPTPTNATDNQGGFLQNVRALLTDSRWEENGVGQGELFSQFPMGELTSVHLASVSKVMTLLLAVEAIDAGDVGLGDIVQVSQLAANLVGPNASNMGLEFDEEQTLETLLYGMMLRSANDGSAAIAEHVAGDWEDFVAMMQARADDLGLTDTTYGLTSTPGGTPAGGGISTPQDQVTLWRFANQNPLFREIASARSYVGCGTDGAGDPKCHILSKFGDSEYPGLDGWKGGNGGYFVPGYSNNGPFCVGSGCLIAETTRLGRTMQVALQQSGNRWNDHDEMLTWGYRMQFTADRRGGTRIVGQVVDFDLDHIGDQVALIATINQNNRPELCTYSLFADLGQITPLGCEGIELTGVAGSADQAVPTKVDGALISTFLVEGDYLTGYTTGSINQLNLNLWRVGPTEP
ncbi:MAG: serine hydrolase [Pseudomonadota bacterium]